MGWQTRVSADIGDPGIRRALPSRQEPYWQTYATNRALGIRKSPNGDIAWMGRYKTQSGQYRRVQLSIATSPNLNAMNFEQAMEVAESLFGQPNISSQKADSQPFGRNSQLNYSPWGDVYTVGHALSDYYVWSGIAFSETHQRGMLSRINKHLLPRLGQIPVAELNFEVVRDFCFKFLGTGDLRKNVMEKTITRDQLNSRKRTLNMTLSALRCALKMAWENEKFESKKPWLCIRFIRVPKAPRMLQLSREDCRKLAFFADCDMRELILAALYSGCRAKELTNMKVKDVARLGFGVFVNNSKTYKPRFVFLADEAMSFFLDICCGKNAEDLLFHRRDGQPWNYAYQNGFKTAVLKAGLPKTLTFHELRHTYASQLVQSGMQLGLVAQQLGHSNIATVAETYGHFSPQIIEAEINAKFSGILADEQARAIRRKNELAELRLAFHQQNWRAYGDETSDLNPNAVFELEWIAGDPERATSLLKFKTARDKELR